MNEERIGVLAAHAVARGLDPEPAWRIAREVDAEFPDELEAAAREIVARADKAGWSSSV